MTTHSASIAATAASTALPPSFSSARPASAPSGWPVATAAALAVICCGILGFGQALAVRLIALADFLRIGHAAVNPNAVATRRRLVRLQSERRHAWPAD